ncbi:Mtm1p Ecym_5110 [Eremothecium cymbalariae DBVPG|uniref:Mitochondrial carrier protein MTM1 n=1 Tax=Eremothecium cymbalariae (strain CBS 270.75 / DBVPG 7215 / KCTC 17166 / NRRL Y-17582) TaxID=931890 RepID=I6NCU9_ERECY|nr:hypothetical protein Ecym_5110 [Eremothecium cymbalariae DBVPG\
MSSDSYVRLKEKMISASAGSLATSLFLTPMDVVRVRLQQQEMLPECSCVGVEGSKVNLSSESVNVGKLFWQDACFQDIQCKNTSLRFNNTWEALLKISKVEGLKTLWTGISLTLLMAIPANVVYYSGYETLRDNSPLSQSFPNLNPLVCGAISRIVAATSVAPLELARTRLQSIPRTSKDVSTLKVVKDLVKEFKKEVSVLGLRALFRGLELTLWRDVPFSAIYWGSYEFYKSSNFQKHMMMNSESTWDYFLTSLLGGAISGAIAALVTHPFDLGKTRMQIAIVNSSSRNANTSSYNKPSSGFSSPQHSMFGFLNHIRKTEGVKALYTGLLPRMMKIAPSCAIMISTYEVSKKFFSS